MLHEDIGEGITTALEMNPEEKIRVVLLYLPWHKVAVVTYSPLPIVSDEAVPPDPPCARLAAFKRSMRRTIGASSGRPTPALCESTRFFCNCAS